MRILYVTPTERKAILVSLKPESHFWRMGEDGHPELLITSDGTAGGVIILALRVLVDFFPEADVATGSSA